MKARNFLILILGLLIVGFSISNSSAINTIDELAYVVAIGFDVGESSDLKISFQINMPSSSSSSSSGEGSSDNSSSDDTSVINTVECNSFDVGVSLLNSYLSKKVNMSHCKYLIFSEELASSGIGDYIYSLKNNIEIRPSCNVLISKCSANYFLQNSKPVLNEVATKYFGLETSSEKNTSYTEAVTLKDFFCDLSDTFGNPYAILGSINGISSNNVGNNNQSLDDQSYVAKEIDEGSQKNIENLGLAIFKEDKLIGELSGLETIMHLLICNNFQNATVNIPSPFSDSDYISLYIYSGKSKNSVKIVNGTPYIQCNVSLKMRLLTSSQSSNYMTEENKRLIEEYTNSYFAAHINEYLYKTSKELNSDVCSFGQYAISNFLTWDDWTDYNWLDKYQESFFSPSVNSRLTSSYLLMETNS